MASENKKNKSKNSHWESGFEKNVFRFKREGFFNKKQRNKIKKIDESEYET